MRHWILAGVTPLLVAASLTTARAALIVDFGLATTSPVAAGMTNGNVANNPSNGSPSITYVNLSGISTGFGTAAVQGVVTMDTGNIPSNTFRAVNRTPAAKTAIQNPGLNNNTANDDFYRDWIAVTRLTTTSGGVVTAGASPTLTFTISGLDPGLYTWTSWHHDIEDQTGLINYTFTDALGAASGVINGSHGQNAASFSNTGDPSTPNTVNGRGLPVNGTGDPTNNPPGTPTAFTQNFTVGGSGSFTFAMSSGYNPALSTATTNLPNTASSLNFAVINGFQVVQAPEPSTMTLLGTFALVATLLAKRRKQ